MPLYLSYLARAYAELGQFDDAWRCIGEAMTAMETTKERWCEAEIHRIAGEIALMSPEPDAAKAEAYFERALAVARQQQAKSWELRAAMSMARLWRDQGKRERGPRTARSGLRLVHRRVRHARSEGGEGAARRAARLTPAISTLPDFVAAHESGSGPLCENSDAELARRISISISSPRKPIALVGAAGRGQLRKQF